MSNKRYFIISIDTEGDNQWEKTNKITTFNADYLPRFQEISEKFHFKPVWLTNYEMAQNENFVSYMRKKQNCGLCEIGMHLHAWNNPPEFKLQRINDQKDYLIEYPVEIMEKKISFLTKYLSEKFGVQPVSHRSGRWTTNKVYFDILDRNGFLIDCSVTPLVNWSNIIGSTGTKGTDYSLYSTYPNMISEHILEVPMTIQRIHFFDKNRINCSKAFFSEVKKLIMGRTQWLRPDSSISIKGLKKIIDNNTSNDYLMFMIHSSELMPGGSPNFKDKMDIEKLYGLIELLFKHIYDLGYEGITLRDYREVCLNANKKQSRL